MAGVTWQSQIVPVRVLGIGGGSTFDILNGILYAAGLRNDWDQTAQLCQVQNLSLTPGEVEVEVESNGGTAHSVPLKTR